MRRNIIFLITFLTYAACISAQETNLFRHFKVQHWDTKNGLPNDLVLTMHQSKDGFLWLTTYSGVTRFDGVHFANYNTRNVPQMKTENIENAVMETADTTIWIATSSGGLLSYKKGQFNAYMTDLGLTRYMGALPGEEMLFITNNQNKPYVTFNPNTKTHRFLTDSSIVNLFAAGKVKIYGTKDKAGNQWTRLQNKLVRISNGKIHELGAAEGIDPDVIYLRFFVDSQDRVWLTSNKGLLIWNGTRVVPYPGMEKVTFSAAYFITTLVLNDSENGLWVASSLGFAYLPAGESVFQFMPNSSVFSAQNITNLLTDREGNAWFSSQDGLYKASYSKFLNYSTEDGLPNNRISGVCAIDSNRYLVGAEGRLWWIDHGKVSRYVFKNKSLDIDRGDITHIYMDNAKTIWVCASAGIYRITGKGETFFATGTRADFAYEDDDHKMWFGVAFRGICSVNEKDELYFENFPQVDMKSLFISTFLKLKQGGWLIGSYNKGVLFVDEQGKPDYFADSAGRPRMAGVFSTYQDEDGTIWLSTQSGIYRYKNKELVNVSVRDGMPENPVFNFLPDHLGTIWLPTNRGLIAVNKKQLSSYCDNKANKISFRFYDDGDGMRNRQCVGARHGAVTADGKVLILTFGGLLEIKPGEITTNKLPPPVIIHRVIRDDSEINLSKKNVFLPGNHRYIFEYSALSMVAPEKVQIKFKLTGYDKDWIVSVGDRKAFYTNIPSGTYSFQVIACNNDGVWNNTGDTVTFTIQPFFYETTWFRVLLAAMLIALVWILVRWRTRAVQKQNALLETQVTERTKDLNKSNAALAMQKENLENTLTELKSTQSLLVQSEKMASLGELTAGIAHEIQNPLNFVNNFSEINNELIEEANREMDNGKGETTKELMLDIYRNNEKILLHGKRADAIVKGMLEHSRQGTGQKQPTDINSVADEYLKLSYHGMRAKDKSFNATIKTEFDSSIGQINIVAQDIGRVLLNLYNNAFYALNEKIKMNNEKYEPTLRVETKKEGANVVITVGDNGNGIPENIVDKIFQPFFTTKPTGQGTGLGLSLSYDIIKAHGGELKVKAKKTQSELEPTDSSASKVLGMQGSEFIINLPIV